MCREFPPAPHGGTGSTTHELVKVLQSKNNRIYINSRFFCEEFKESNLKRQYTESMLSRYIEKIPISLFDSIYYAYQAGSKTNKLLKLNDIDVVEAPSHGAESLFYSINKSIPLVIRLHGFLSKVPIIENDNLKNNKSSQMEESTIHFFRSAINKENRQILWELEKKAILNADALISPSLSMKKFVLNEINEIDDKDIKVIYNGIDFEVFDQIQPDEEVIRKKYNIKIGNKIVSYAGRISKPKGLETLIKAIPQVLSEYKDVTFVLMGPIIDKSLIELSKKINGSIYINNIIFTGRIEREDVYKLLKISDLLVHPSLYEVLPTIILEAMASKKPVIASDISPHKELIRDCKNGFLFETYNYEDLANKILELLTDLNKSKKMGIYGYEIVSKDFTINKNGKVSLELYNSLVC